MNNEISEIKFWPNLIKIYFDIGNYKDNSS